MYVELLTGGQKIVALVDNRATHNFISTRETARLGLKLTKDDSKLNGKSSWPTLTLCGCTSWVDITKWQMR